MRVLFLVKGLKGVWRIVINTVPYQPVHTVFTHNRYLNPSIPFRTKHRSLPPNTGHLEKYRRRRAYSWQFAEQRFREKNKRDRKKKKRLQSRNDFFSFLGSLFETKGQKKRSVFYQSNSTCMRLKSQFCTLLRAPS